MATPISGTGGLVKIVGTPDTTVGEIKQWDGTIEREQYDASTLGTTWRRKVPGIGAWSGKLTGFYAVKTDAGQTVLQNAVLNGSTQLYLELETANGTYDGLANPSKIDIGNPVDGIVTFDVTFEGDGPLAFS